MPQYTQISLSRIYWGKRSGGSHYQNDGIQRVVRRTTQSPKNITLKFHSHRQKIEYNTKEKKITLLIL
jgi:hypothetical protein